LPVPGLRFTYPYFDNATRGVDFSGMLNSLKQLPPRSIVLLHPCCHNPTGADLTNAQWDEVIEVLISRDLIPFLDIAYQGFGAGLEDDAYAIRAIASTGLRWSATPSPKYSRCMASAWAAVRGV
jgi:aromatic-amino-acid transaminase